MSITEFAPDHRELSRRSIHPSQIWQAIARALKRKRRLWLAILFVSAAWLAVPGAAYAQSCWSSSWSLNFATVSTGGNTDVTTQVPYTCQSNSQATYFNICLFVPGGASPTPGINPRTMTNNNGHSINFNLYSNPARTQIIGPPPNGGGYAVYTWNLVVPAGSNQTRTSVSLYGRVPPVPAGTPAATYHQYGLDGSTTLQYAWSNTGAPPSCSGGSGSATGSTTVGFSGISAIVPNGCSIAIAQATNLDFGSASAIAAPIASTSQITLNCPANTNWKVGLNNGMNAVAGQRRMAGPSASYLNYDLYRDPGHTQRWGNDTAGGSDTVNGSGASQANPTVLTVYGLVPAQSVGVPGTYSDTITVTLTY